MNNRTLRDRYVAESVATASPARLVVMLYDRLVLDLRQAEAALLEQDGDRAFELTQHATSIVGELLASLDPTAWDGARNLQQLYGWFLKELIGAGLRRDVERVRGVRALVEPLQEAWREAAVLVTPAEVATRAS
jgi:flagellar protein FliS